MTESNPEPIAPNLTDIQQAIEAFGRRRYDEGRAHGEAAANRALGDGTL